MSHVPRKRFGQHFLVDQHYIQRIVEAIRPERHQRIVEIGPGLAAITAPLLARLDHLHVVEIDRDIVARLQSTYAPERLTIHAVDALRFDFSQLGNELRIVGNLPYNISSPLLFYLAEVSEHITDMTFMLQKEVVDRMVAAPGGGDYGRLSVMLQSRFVLERLFEVPPDAFRPPPKVYSAMVRLWPLPAEATRPSDPRQFAQVVAAAFSQRRKTLRNTLRGLVTEENLVALGIDAGLRAENLSVTDFIRIADGLTVRTASSLAPASKMEPAE